MTKSLDSVLVYFENGVERYKTDLFFKQTIDMLCSGCDCMTVLDHVLKHKKIPNDDKQKNQ